MDNDTALALVEALNAHTQGIKALTEALTEHAFQLDMFDTLAINEHTRALEALAAKPEPTPPTSRPKRDWDSEFKIKDMLGPDKGYTVPWALGFDQETRKYYINSNYTILDERAGTAQMLVEKDSMDVVTVTLTAGWHREYVDERNPARTLPNNFYDFPVQVRSRA
jgi:hypothetical protein